MGENPKVFISHASEDKDRFVRTFATALRENGVEAWFDEWEIKVGDSLVKKIFVEGLQEADAVIVVVSANSINSKWVCEELDAATVERITRDCKLIPVILDNVKVSAPLKHLKWIKIDNTSEYASQQHEILLSIFNREDKPQLGPKPSFMTYEYSSNKIEGLRPDEAQILKLLGETAVKRNTCRLSAKTLEDDCESIGIDKKALSDIIEILESKQIVECTRTVASKMPIRISLTDFGLSVYTSTYVKNLEEITRKVGLAIVNGNIGRSSEITNELDIPIIVINDIVDTFAIKDWIRTRKTASGDRIITDVRAGLKRALL